MRLLLIFTILIFTGARPAHAVMGAPVRNHVTHEPIGVLDLQYLLKYDYNNEDSVKIVWDVLHAVSTLQGIVNRNQPNLYIKYVVTHNVSVDDYWLNKYREPGKWLSTREVIQFNSVDEVFAYYKKYINGLVVYDPEVEATSNIASSIAGVENLVAVRYDKSSRSLYSKLLQSGFPVKERLVNTDGTTIFTGKGTIYGTDIISTGSKKNDAYIWFIEKYLKAGRCNTAFAGYYIDQYWMKNPKATSLNHHTLTNHDFFVSKRGFFFDLSPWGDEPATDDKGQRAGEDLNTLKQMLHYAYLQNKGKKFLHIGGFPAWAFKYTKRSGGQHDDVPTEWEFTQLISAYNAFKDADAIGFGAMANASFWMHYPLKKKYSQNKATLEELKEKKLLDRDGRFIDNNKKYVVFYVGDYDAASWLYQTIPAIWDDPSRGKVPLMWAISPVIERRAPMAMEYLRETATKNDFFVAADNGAGYLNPGMLQAPRPVSKLPDGVKAWEKHNKPFYRRWDLSITGFIIDGYAPPMNDESFRAYASFSKDGIVPQKAPVTKLQNGMPILRSYDGDVVAADPAVAAGSALSRVGQQGIPFNWFRSILKTPAWHTGVFEHLARLDPSITVLDASSFFLLYRQYLLQNREAAAGAINKQQ
ncbi:MAG: GxGYxYP family putative glycoside hydrolase [Niabella sp.]